MENLFSDFNLNIENQKLFLIRENGLRNHFAAVFRNFEYNHKILIKAQKANITSKI